MTVEVVQPHTSPILKISAPIQGCRFEWHQDKKTIYLIRRNLSGQEIGEPIVEHVVINHGLAIMFVHVWCRGYKEAQRVIEQKDFNL